MKKIFIIILFLISIIGNAPPVLAAQARGNYVKKEYYDNGNLRLYLKFRNERISRKISYYRNGRVREDSAYRNGEALRILHYYEDGRLYSVWTKKSGVTKYYHPDGRLRATVDQNSDTVNSDLPSSLIFSGP